MIWLKGMFLSYVVYTLHCTIMYISYILGLISFLFLECPLRIGYIVSTLKIEHITVTFYDSSTL
jgi:hypothetical protein